MPGIIGTRRDPTLLGAVVGVVRDLSLYVGGTAVGIRVEGGVVLATDRRMSYGGFVMSRNFRKVFTVNERIGVAFAGLYGDMGGLIRFLESQARLYESERGKPMTVYAAAKMLSNLLYAYKFYPFLVEALIGGIESGGTKLYVLDPLGSVIEEDYAAAGSGATMAFGVVEASYKRDMAIEDAEELAVNAVKAAIARDAGSGDGVDVVTITPNGVRERSVRFKVVSEA